MIKTAIKTFQIPKETAMKSLKDLKSDFSVIDKVSFMGIFCIIFMIFLKIYISNLVVIEIKKIDNLKYKLKITESELRKLKLQHNRYTDKDSLLELSKNLKEEEKIDVVVVKEW